MEEASSGMEVPIETRVNPIMNSETPSFFAIEEAEATKRSAPFTSNNSPIPKRAISNRGTDEF